MKIRLRVLTFIVIVFQFTMTIGQEHNPMDWPNFKQFEELNTKLPKMKKNNEGIFNFSLEIKGIGTVRAIYKEIRELFTGNSVLNFLIISLFLVQSRNLKSLIFNFDPIL